MTVWLAIAVVLIAATLGVSGCVAYIVISLSRTAPLLGTRLGLAAVQIIKVSSQPRRPARRHRRAQLRVRAAVLPA
jgi:ABC-type proline/glycine betaine transport system permease subunit